MTILPNATEELATTVTMTTTTTTAGPRTHGSQTRLVAAGSSSSSSTCSLGHRRNSSSLVVVGGFDSPSASPPSLTTRTIRTVVESQFNQTPVAVTVGGTRTPEMSGIRLLNGVTGGSSSTNSPMQRKRKTSQVESNELMVVPTPPNLQTPMQFVNQELAATTAGAAMDGEVSPSPHPTPTYSPLQPSITPLPLPSRLSDSSTQPSISWPISFGWKRHDSHTPPELISPGQESTQLRSDLVETEIDSPTTSGESKSSPPFTSEGNSQVMISLIPIGADTTSAPPVATLTFQPQNDDAPSTTTTTIATTTTLQPMAQTENQVEGNTSSIAWTHLTVSPPEALPTIIRAPSSPDAFIQSVSDDAKLDGKKEKNEGQPRSIWSCWQPNAFKPTMKPLVGESSSTQEPPSQPPRCCPNFLWCTFLGVRVLGWLVILLFVGLGVAEIILLWRYVTGVMNDSLAGQFSAGCLDRTKQFAFELSSVFQQQTMVAEMLQIEQTQIQPNQYLNNYVTRSLSSFPYPLFTTLTYALSINSTDRATFESAYGPILSWNSATRTFETSIQPTHPSGFFPVITTLETCGPKEECIYRLTNGNNITSSTGFRLPLYVDLGSIPSFVNALTALVVNQETQFIAPDYVANFTSSQIDLCDDSCLCQENICSSSEPDEDVVVTNESGYRMGLITPVWQSKVNGTLTGVLVSSYDLSSMLHMLLIEPQSRANSIMNPTAVCMGDFVASIVTAPITNSSQLIQPSQRLFYGWRMVNETRGQGLPYTPADPSLMDDVRFSNAWPIGVYLAPNVPNLDWTFECRGDVTTHADISEHLLQQIRVAIINVVLVSLVTFLLYLLFRWYNAIDIERRMKDQSLFQMDQAILAAESARDAKTDFMAFLCHELRNPLHAVLSMAESLKDTTLNADQSESVFTIHASSELMLAITNDILDLSKIEAGKVELEIVHIDLWALIHSLIRANNSQAQERGVKVIGNIDPRVPRYIQADPTRLNQIITNLMSNAIKFSHKHGEVRLEVEIDSDDEEDDNGGDLPDHDPTAADVPVVLTYHRSPADEKSIQQPPTDTVIEIEPVRTASPFSPQPSPVGGHMFSHHGVQITEFDLDADAPPRSEPGRPPPPPTPNLPPTRLPEETPKHTKNRSRMTLMPSDSPNQFKQEPFNFGVLTSRFLSATPAPTQPNPSPTWFRRVNGPRTTSPLTVPSNLPVMSTRFLSTRRPSSPEELDQAPGTGKNMRTLRRGHSRSKLFKLEPSQSKSHKRGGNKSENNSRGNSPNRPVKLLFKVVDQGCGIPPESLPALFEPYTQAKRSITRSHGGTGLGLAIVKKLGDLMHAVIEVESEPNVQTTFSFCAEFMTAPPPSARMAALMQQLPQHGEEIHARYHNYTSLEINQAAAGVSSANHPIETGATDRTISPSPPPDTNESPTFVPVPNTPLWTTMPDLPSSTSLTNFTNTTATTSTATTTNSSFIESSTRTITAHSSAVELVSDESISRDDHLTTSTTSSNISVSSVTLPIPIQQPMPIHAFGSEFSGGASRRIAHRRKSSRVPTDAQTSTTRCASIAANVLPHQSNAPSIPPVTIPSNESSATPSGTATPTDIAFVSPTGCTSTSSSSPSASPITPYSKLHLLVVDDAAINRRIMHKILDELYELDDAADGLEALEKVKANPTKYSCVLMDLMMPVMGGTESLLAIRACGFTHLPIIAVTANTMNEDIEKCLSVGFTAFLSKPCRKDILRGKIKELIHLESVSLTPDQGKDTPIDLFITTPIQQTRRLVDLSSSTPSTKWTN